jgi:hypothetical protein
VTDDAKAEAEIKRLATPDEPPPPFLRWWWRNGGKMAWWWTVYYLGLAVYLIVEHPFPTWATAVVTGFMGGLVGSMHGLGYTRWRLDKKHHAYAVEWVEKIATRGPKPWGYDIAWTMKHLIDEEKVHVAAHLALGLLAQDYPDRFPPPEPDCG